MRLLKLLAAIGIIASMAFGQTPIDGSSLFWELTDGTLTISGEGAMPSFGGAMDKPWLSNKESITTVIIEDDVTNISMYAFSAHENLTKVTIGNSVTDIEAFAFVYCYGLTEITIGNSVENIGSEAFRNCLELTSVNIPSSVTSIASQAFAGCSGLTELTIPGSVTSIGRSAFEGCTGLTEITIPKSVTSIGDNVFLDCSGLTEVIVSSENSKYSSDNGLLFNKNKTQLLQCLIVKGRTTYTIPNSVTSIGDAFRYCSDLTSITIPSSVTSIGNYAFQLCKNLKAINFLGNKPTTISDYSISNNAGLVITHPCSNVSWDGYVVPYFATLAQSHDYTDFGDWEVTDDATCETAGSQTRTVACSRDEEHKTDNEVEVIPALDHDYVWTQQTPATCVAKEVEKGVCSHNATHTDTREIGEVSNKHDTLFGDWVTTAATCETAGNKTRTVTCKLDVAGHILPSEVEPIAKLPHSFEWVVTTTPTCDAEGVETEVCSVCEATGATQPVAKLTDCDNGATPIIETAKTGDRMLFRQTIVCDKMEIILEDIRSVRFVVYDMTGNVVMDKTGRTWDLRNNAGRIVANGSYLVVVEATANNGKIERYSSKLGVNR